MTEKKEPTSLQRDQRPEEAQRLVEKELEGERPQKEDEKKEVVWVWQAPQSVQAPTQTCTDEWFFEAFSEDGVKAIFDVVGRATSMSMSM